MNDSVTPVRGATRRSILRQAAALAVAAPTLAVVLQSGTAFADDGDHDADDRQPHPVPAPRQHLNVFSADLSTVAQTAASGDFTSSNAGSDPLSDGRVRLQRRGQGADERHLQVALRGAAPNAQYEVFFWAAASGKARESLGVVGPTDRNGNLAQVTPAALAGTNRVGLFVLVRHDGSDAGKDEFVSSMGG